MDNIPFYAVRECLRETSALLGYSQLSELARALVEVDGSIPPDEARHYLYEQNCKSHEDELVKAGLDLIRANMNTIKTHYQTAKANETYDYLENLVNRNNAPPVLDIITRNWRSPRERGRRVIYFEQDRNARTIISNGIFQVFRRYKPTVPERNENRKFYSDESNHIVICELIYVDSSSMECRLVTSESNLYWGALYINHQRIMYGNLERPERPDTNGVYQDIFQRLYSVNLGHRKQAFYSGLCLKTGDTTGRPLAAECIFLPVPRAEHTELYAAFQNLLNLPWSHEEIEIPPEIVDYIAPPPPKSGDEAETLKRVRRIRDFPFLKNLAKKQRGTGIQLFRESLRTLEADAVQASATSSPCRVYRYSQAGLGTPAAPPR